MTPIERLLATRPDSFESFDLAHSLLMTHDTPMADKVVALGRIDAAMGGTSEPINETAVNDYIRVHQEG